MLKPRPSGERGRTRLSWLDSSHTFSFGEYFDPRQMGFRSLRVLNEDRVAPGGGFGTHAHRDMEIVSYVVEGALEHKDSLGNGSTLRPGEVQRMSAGAGIEHSEFNPSRTEPAHFLQVWIVPETRGLKPGYEQQSFALDAARDRLVLLASRDGREGSVRIHQDVSVWGARLAVGSRVEHHLAPRRGAWLQIVRGRVRTSGVELWEGDGAGVEEEPRLGVEALDDAELLLFDLA
jgi:hypothetical protein